MNGLQNILNALFYFIEQSCMVYISILEVECNFVSCIKVASCIMVFDARVGKGVYIAKHIHYTRFLLDHWNVIKKNYAFRCIYRLWCSAVRREEAYSQTILNHQLLLPS